MTDLIVIGGGAAGFYGALQAAEKNPKLSIVILEKSSKLLAKVGVSGGGRCNVTHHEFNPARLAHHYPRGEKTLKMLFRAYQPENVLAWFAEKGVALKVEDDGRMFPVTNTSQTIIDCFLNEARKHAIRIELNQAVIKLEQLFDHFKLTTAAGESFICRKVLVTIGGHPQRNSYQWLEEAGHTITPLLPSLFTFNDPHKRLAHLMGVSVSDAVVKIEGTKFYQQGPLLITHWGLSGPAAIRLSAWAAPWLHDKKYECTLLVNWIGTKKEEVLRKEFLEVKAAKPKLKILTNPMYQLPQRLWQALCTEAEIDERLTWGDVSLRNLNRLLENLIRFRFTIKGKTTFKEEFVTCGGVDLQEINPETMESRKIKHLYFAGEVLNIDGETGGFNFQAAWTTAWIAAQQIGEK
jgi:predicted Rossmann fold flavoprotein